MAYCGKVFPNPAQLIMWTAFWQHTFRAWKLRTRRKRKEKKNLVGRFCLAPGWLTGDCEISPERLWADKTKQQQFCAMLQFCKSKTGQIKYRAKTSDSQVTVTSLKEHLWDFVIFLYLVALSILSNLKIIYHYMSWMTGNERWNCQKIYPASYHSDESGDIGNGCWRWKIDWLSKRRSLRFFELRLSLVGLRHLRFLSEVEGCLLFLGTHFRPWVQTRPAAPRQPT